MRILLVGNPNCGKSTIFNALTGLNQKVGNWPGVTVEKKTGVFNFEDQNFEITDLPGIYSLSHLNKLSPDEQIATEAILSLPYDLIINVIDASHLERHLYLSSQLLELGKPLIIAINMMDLASQQEIKIDTTRLAKELECTVLSLEAHKKIGLRSLQETIKKVVEPAKPLPLKLAADLETNIEELKSYLSETKNFNSALSHYYALRILEGDGSVIEDENLRLKLKDSDLRLADARYSYLNNLVNTVCKKKSHLAENITAKIDKIVLNRYLGLPIFFTMMYTMFLFAVNGGGILQDFLDKITQVVFIEDINSFLLNLKAPKWLTILAQGLGVGINTTVSLIPVIGSMFFFLALLETSGYMARAAFVVDKLMRILGLPGKSFVPLIIGFGCNVPAVMAARTLDSEKERLLTVLMSPFMSCTARLAIYAVFVAAFFPKSGGSIVFCLYLIGIIMAVLTGYLLRKILFPGKSSPLILELPTYHRPKFTVLMRETYLRLKYFIKRAGRMIIPFCLIFTILNSIHWEVFGQSYTLISLIGKSLTPLFYPIGLQDSNWPATVSLLTGMLAKEVVLGSLNSLYMQLDSGVTQSSYIFLRQHFDGQAGAFAYLLFILLYIPCVSTMAAIRQESSRFLMYFSISWSLLLAYVIALIFYQTMRFSLHPLQSSLWILGMLACLFVFLFSLNWRTKRRNLGASYATANS